MRLALSLSLLALGCTDDPPRGGPAIDSHVESYDVVASVPYQLDLLIVLDHTTAMASYQTALGALPGAIVTFLTDNEPDVRIALTTVDGTGAVRQPSAASDAYLALGYDVHYQRSANYAGALSDALAQLIGVGATASVTSQPLASASAALDAHPMRARAGLGVITITATDDGSSGTIVDYATEMKARKTDPTQVALSGIYPDPATRLDSFHDQFPSRASTQDIATADFTNALELFSGLLKIPLGYACPVEPADVDAETPGPQYDCDLNAYYDDGTSEAVRQCKADSTGPCFRFEADPICMLPGTAHFALDGFPGRWHPGVRGQCVVTGQN